MSAGVRMIITRSFHFFIFLFFYFFWKAFFGISFVKVNNGRQQRSWNEKTCVTDSYTFTFTRTPSVAGFTPVVIIVCRPTYRVPDEQRWQQCNGVTYHSHNLHNSPFYMRFIFSLSSDPSYHSSNSIPKKTESRLGGGWVCTSPPHFPRLKVCGNEAFTHDGLQNVRQNPLCDQNLKMEKKKMNECIKIERFWTWCGTKTWMKTGENGYGLMKIWMGEKQRWRRMEKWMWDVFIRPKIKTNN